MSKAATAPARKLNIEVGGKFSPNQEAAVRLLNGPQRHTMLVGGTRSGKTFIIIRRILTRAIYAPKSRHVILRQNFNACKKTIWLDTLPKVHDVCFKGLTLKFNHTDTYIQVPWSGAEIWLGGLDDKERLEKILGTEYSTVYLNECSQIKYEAALYATNRLAQKSVGLRNRAYYDLNPVGKGHWTHKLFIQGVKPESPLERLNRPENYGHFFLNPGDNAENIDPEFIEDLHNLPERQRRRFLEGRYIDEMEGALWTLEGIESDRISWDDLPPLVRIVVAVDPSGAEGDWDVKKDEIGIVVAGIDKNKTAYVLEDCSGLYSPEQWGSIVAQRYSYWKADRVIGEKNYGGDMVRAVIHGANRSLSYKGITASRGKVVRAEPVAALYERHRVHHVSKPDGSNPFRLLEDEMMNFSTAGYLGAGSPNRGDALVWALSELCVEEIEAQGTLDWYAKQADASRRKAEESAGKLLGNVFPGVAAVAEPKPALGPLSQDPSFIRGVLARGGK